MLNRGFRAFALLWLLTVSAQAQQSEAPPIFINGASPQIAVVAGHENRSEAGIGALLPWAELATRRRHSFTTDENAHQKFALVDCRTRVSEHGHQLR